jgi:uncharacterized membrane protein YhaH (DUF805 family)
MQNMWKDFARLFTSAEGRIPRLAYWIGFITILLVELVVRFLLGIPLAPTPADPFSIRALSFLIDAALLYPTVIIMVKRFHDRDRSGQLIGWFVVPYSVIMLTNLLGMSGDPDHMGVVETLLLIATTIITLAFIVDLGFRPGTPGDNQYGPDPVGRTTLRT